MESLVIQLGVKHGRVAELARLDAGELSIGRGFGNDIVLSDPYVAPDQLRISDEQGQWCIEVLDNTNPVLLNGEPVAESMVSIRSGDRLTVGRTNLLLYANNHTVERTRKLLLSSWLHNGSTAIFISLAVLLLVSLFDGFMDYIQLSNNRDWKQYALATLVTAVLISIWAGFWALAGSLFRQQPHFGAQLLVSSLVFGALVIVAPVGGYLAYNSSSLAFNEAISYLATFIGLAILFKFNLVFATHIKKTSMVATLMAALLIGFSYATDVLQTEDFNTEPSYSAVLKPPITRVGGDVSIEDYFAELGHELSLIDIDEPEPKPHFNR